MKRRIKHNDLLPWFTMDHGQLPASYLKSCQKFFDGLQVTSYKLPGPRSISNANKGLIHKRQATSSPQLDAMIDPLQKINRKELKKL
jgi:hypothetical protein